jgi:tetratricopeptide (TPR) repeat protein
MKNLIYLFLLFTTTLFFAQNDFEKGNELYKKGNYKEAVVAYEHVLQSKKHSSELYFNLGNAYYKLNKVAPSIYNYEKALVLNPEDLEIKNNLKFAHKLQIDEIKEIPTVGFAKLLQHFTAIYHYDTWAWITVSLAFLFLISFLGYLFSLSVVSKRIFFLGMFVLIFLILISISSALFERDRFVNDRPAIVFAEMVSVKKEPKISSSNVLMIHEGAKVYVQEVLNQWMKIKLTDGTIGWIEKDSIREVKNNNLD